MNKITNVADFLNLISHLDTKQNVFYRGHSNNTYDLEPGIYRKTNNNKTLIQFEDKIFREVISKSPQDFVGKNTLETLALLQHYEAPTRVLDLTENALVALYFACIGSNHTDGEVIIFDIPDESVCHYNSDRITILANLAKCEKEFEYNSELVLIYQEKKQKFESKVRNYEDLETFKGVFNKDIFNFYNQKYEFIKTAFFEKEFEFESFDNDLNKLKKEFEEGFGELTSTDFKFFNNKYIDIIKNMYDILIHKNIRHINLQYFGKLLHNIKEDKPYFDSIIDPSDVSKIFAVRPKLDNPRIVKQHGAFLIFGVEEVYFRSNTSKKYKPMAKIDEKWIVKLENNKKLLIDKDYKEEIEIELDSLGLNQSTLFPEVDKVANFVRNKYQKKL